MSALKNDRDKDRNPYIKESSTTDQKVMDTRKIPGWLGYLAGCGFAAFMIDVQNYTRRQPVEQNIPLANFLSLSVGLTINLVLNTVTSSLTGVEIEELYSMSDIWFILASNSVVSLTAYQQSQKGSILIKPLIRRF